jgi:multisubunit Na+/H+ antiporter MnhC subunit
LIQIKTDPAAHAKIVAKETIMPMSNALFLVAVVVAFCIFGAVLAWGDYQTKHIDRT